MLPLKKTVPDNPGLVISHRRKDYWENASFIDELIALKKARYREFKARKLLHTSIGLMLSLLMVLGLFEWKKYDKNELVEFNQGAAVIEDLLDVPVTQQPPPPPKKVLVQPNIVAVPEEEIIDELEIDLDMEITEETSMEEIIVFPEEDVLEEEEAEEIFLIVENAPVPPGGLEGFYRYVSENIEYPLQAQRMNISGKVFVQFIVNTDGTLSEIMAVKGIGGGCDEEAVRVLSGAPKWTPGNQRGKNVRVRMVIPIVFMLQG